MNAIIANLVDGQTVVKVLPHCVIAFTKMTESDGDVHLTSVRISVNNVVIAKFGATHVYSGAPFQRSHILTAKKYETIKEQLYCNDPNAIYLCGLLTLIDTLSKSPNFGLVEKLQ